MRFRRLVIRIQTTNGPYGTTLDFPDGLVVVWADNSMGKSTCVKLILVALGMEAMLTTSQSELPLPPAVVFRLESDEGEVDVLESEVLLEIENSSGQRLTVQRTIKGNRDKNLITIYEGPLLTSHANAAPPSRDLYVNRAGAATRQLGFHHFLAEFLGWELPTVQTFEGNEYPLYIQCVFPYFVVEQTRGWSTIQPPLPTQFRIKEAHKRAVEFLLNLDAHKIALKRQELLLEKTKIESAWKAQVAQIADFVESSGGIAQALPQHPTSTWPPTVYPTLVVPQEDDWITLGERIASRERQLTILVEQEIPRVQETAALVQSELAQTEREVCERQAILMRLVDAHLSEREEVSRIQKRLEAIDDDIQRYKDVQTLKNLGSRQGSEVDSGTCPVCHQTVHDSLLPMNAEQTVMTLSENIEFLCEQKRTFEAVLENAKRIVEARSSQIMTGNNELEALRSRVRDLRQTLLSDGRQPSEAAIRARIELRNDITADRKAQARFEKALTRLGELSKLLSAVLIELNALPKSDATSEDAKRVAEWTRLLRVQLDEYGFKSIRASQVVISLDSYRPEAEGFDLQSSLGIQGAASGSSVTSFQMSVSASDIIRTIWSYLHGMLELARFPGTRHPGCIIFDEPRQQSTRDLSFTALLARASKSSKFNQQVIFFTSENLVRLKSQLSSVPHVLCDFPGRVLKKI